jgi:ribose 5-phosphate isomerase B
LRIAIGADHAGFRLKQQLMERLAELGHEAIDFGTDSEKAVDYPPICASVARAVVRGEAERGIVLGGSGQGEAMAANKVHGARAALCNDVELARLAREHNDANIVAIGGRIVTEEEALTIVQTFLSTPFEGGRHIPRLEKMIAIEEEECR